MPRPLVRGSRSGPTENASRVIKANDGPSEGVHGHSRAAFFASRVGASSLLKTLTSLAPVFAIERVILGRSPFAKVGETRILRSSSDTQSLVEGAGPRYETSEIRPS